MVNKQMDLFKYKVLTKGIGLCTLIFGMNTATANIQKKIALCETCHSPKMIEQVNTYPVLQGQKMGYLIAQLQSFRAKERQDPVMSEQAKALTDDEIQELASYFSQQTLHRDKADSIDSLGMNVRAHCISCHGLSGHSVNQEWPNLQGQNSQYIYKQLQAFASGQRQSIIMHEIASELNDEQMQAVAKYYQQQGREQ